MQALLAPLRELAEYEDITKALREGRTITLTGCVDSQKLHMIYGLSGEQKVKVIVTYSESRASEICEEYRFYDRNTLLYPAKDLIFFQADIHGNQLTRERVKVLRRLYEQKPVTIVATFAALMTPQIRWTEADVITVEKGECLKEEVVAGQLVNMGYTRSYQVEEPGQFSIRGGILDVFDLTEENPVRIELWGDEVESIRSFDVLSQRSVEDLECVTVFPASEFVMDEEDRIRGLGRIRAEAQTQEKAFRDAHKPEEAARIAEQVRGFEEALTQLGNVTNLESYVRYFYEKVNSLPGLLYACGQKVVFFLEEAARIQEHASAVETEFRESMEQRILKGYLLPGQADVLFSVRQTAADMEKMSVVLLTSIESRNTLFKSTQRFDIAARSIASYNNSFESLVKDLKEYVRQKSRVLLLSGSRTRAERLARDLRDYGLFAVYSEDPSREVLPGEVLTCYGHVGKGFEYPLLKFVVIAETDIFGAQKKKKKRRHYEGQKIADFNELHVGDLVVHESHGLGIYQGIEKVEMGGVVRDYMKITYRDGGNLYVLATGLDVIQKYASTEGGKTPKLNKLGTREWEKTKTKVRSAVDEVAKDLVELYARRQQTEGFRYGPDTVWQREFEEMFPFEETEDQLRAISDTKADMESGKVMDRLICGDVGYGKTEIAIRAAFKAVQEGRQVVYLVPTTILAQQHYTTFVQRMKDFPVRIDMLSRFCSAKQQKDTIRDLKKGQVDILIGTHRVLSDDVVYKDLGLLIIDEEQRFGVAHKEKIKKLKENVDVLTLTATPIPRTLHMSLVGIRDMSVLEEAPEDRRPIQTYVMEYNEEIVREAIVRELSRNGQVYYVYNRVNNIADIAAGINRLVPEANVAFAHGQMKEAELERIMLDFVNGDIDVLVATTIIETGLDIPNVNTMIIQDSDSLGLSQLYQLRGRVGRSGRNAYAFLMYKRDKLLKEVAEKRLAAIREFTELGSGFKIAMRDLEIRGAGNLLGTRQHGHMEAVGYDLYCKFLNEAVKKQKGQTAGSDFTTVVDMDVDAYIPPQYIVNEVQKLDIYKRIAGIANERESDDMCDELLDRFGQIPPSVEHLLKIALIRAAAHELDITEVRGKGGKLRFFFRKDANVDPGGIPVLLRQSGGRMKFMAADVPVMEYTCLMSGLVEKDEEILLSEADRLLKRMQEVLIRDSRSEKF